MKTWTTHGKKVEMNDQMEVLIDGLKKYNISVEKCKDGFLAEGFSDSFFDTTPEDAVRRLLEWNFYDPLILED